MILWCNWFLSSISSRLLQQNHGHLISVSINEIIGSEIMCSIFHIHHFKCIFCAKHFCIGFDCGIERFWDTRVFMSVALSVTTTCFPGSVCWQISAYVCDAPNVRTFSKKLIRMGFNSKIICSLSHRLYSRLSLRSKFMAKDNSNRL